MDPLSALPLRAVQRMMAGAELRAAQLTAPALQTSLAKPIPAAELEALNPAPGLQAPQCPAGTNPFESLLKDLVNDVNQKQKAAGDAVQGMLSGEAVSLHQAMIALEEAGVSFELMVEVRNKLLDSYQELMRMQV